MAKEKKDSSKWLGKLGFWRDKTNPLDKITQNTAFSFGLGSSTIASLLGSGNNIARQRDVIYQKWQTMESNPIISSALQLLVTAALGGHETRGDMIFIEKTLIAKQNKQLAKITDEIAANLCPLFNKIAFHIAYTGTAYGDAFARIYADKNGVCDICADEMLRPQLIQPFERGSQTIGYTLNFGEKNFERLNIAQVARLKMPRIGWIPQFGVLEKSLKTALTQDEFEKLPILPAMVGGSFLYNAEEPFDNLTASLLGLVGQRWLDSIDEQIFTLNMTGMSSEQQARFMQSVKKMLEQSKQIAEKSLKNNKPQLERLRHLLPVVDDKQIINVMPANGGAVGRSNSINIEDIMLHARLLAGALGVDLSMLGFADQLSGGLGDGGFFRVSAQAAEKSRVIRYSLSDFFEHIINIHCLNRYGVVFAPNEKPYQINYYGSISALEAEKQRTRTEAMNTGMLLVQSIQMFKDLGANQKMMHEFLTKTMLLDEEQAELYSQIVANEPAQELEENEEENENENDEED